MQFYPHKTSVNTTATAVSASIALTGSLINNFSAIAINRVLTASVALNITGSQGTDGTSVSVVGPTGPTGPRGETGYRGGNIFLLSSSWNGNTCGAGVVCYPLGGVDGYTLYRAGPGTDCTLSGGTLYNTSYTSDLTLVTNTAADGFILFRDRTCSTVAANVGVHNFNRIFYTDGAGVISSVACSSPPPGECYEVTNTNPSQTSGTISWTDISGTSRSGTLGASQTTNICSLTVPTENPAADVTVTACGNPCGTVCTTIDCVPQCTC